MKEGADLLRRVRVASPCAASWDAMEGDERVRFCGLCNLHVYNLSEMTASEAASLVARTEGRLCGRFYRRADGTVLTKDCPTGLRAVRRRAARRAGTALTAVLSLCGFALGQDKGKGKGAESCDTGASKVLRGVRQGKGSSLKGTVIDPNGGAIPRARAVAVDKVTGRKYEACTTDDGEFVFASLPPGTYEVEVSAPYFKSMKMTQLAVGRDEAVQLDLTLGLEGTEEVGIVVVDGPLEQSGNGVTVFGEKEIKSLPPP